MPTLSKYQDGVLTLLLIHIHYFGKKVQKGQYPFKMYTVLPYLDLKDAYQ